MMNYLERVMGLEELNPEDGFTPEETPTMHVLKEEFKHLPGYVASL